MPEALPILGNDATIFEKDWTEAGGFA